MFNGATLNLVHGLPTGLVGRMPRGHLAPLVVPRSFTEQFANNPQSTLVRDLLPDDSSFELADASAFSSSGYFRTIVDGEIIGVGARDGNWCSTLTRGHESTGRALHLAGATVTQMLTAGAYIQGILDRVGSGTPTLQAAYAPATADSSLFGDLVFRDVPGCAITLTSGTWLVWGQITLTPASLCTCRGKIYNQTDAVDIAGELGAVGGGFLQGFNMHGKITISGTKSIRLAGTNDFGGGTIVALYGGAGTMPISSIMACQVAP